MVEFESLSIGTSLPPPLLPMMHVKPCGSMPTLHIESPPMQLQGSLESEIRHISIYIRILVFVSHLHKSALSFCQQINRKLGLMRGFFNKFNFWNDHRGAAGVCEWQQLDIKWEITLSAHISHATPSISHVLCLICESFVTNRAGVIPSIAAAAKGLYIYTRKLVS